MLIVDLQNNALPPRVNIAQRCQGVQYLRCQVDLANRYCCQVRLNSVADFPMKSVTISIDNLCRRGGDGLPAPGDNLPFSINNRSVH